MTMLLFCIVMPYRRLVGTNNLEEHSVSIFRVDDGSITTKTIVVGKSLFSVSC
jgi:hypothetical protein